MIDLRKGDCLELLKAIPKQKMLLTDIPYEEVNRKDNGLRNLNKDKADVKTFDLGIFLNTIYDKADIFVIFAETNNIQLYTSFFLQSKKKRKEQ